MRRRLAFLSTAIAVSAALLTAPAAQADELTVGDPQGDYWHDTRSEGEEPSPGNPDWGNPDIRRTVYRHLAHTVKVRIKMARLNRGDGGYWKVVAVFRTDEGLTERATFFKPHDGAASKTWSGPTHCAIGGRVDYAEDVFVVEVPRSCLSHPQRVAFKSATRWWPTSDDYPYLDVSGVGGYRLRNWSAPVFRG